MKFVLAGDSGPTVGLGHRRRLEAVGAVLRSRGHDAAFVAVDDAPIPPCDVLVVDSYQTRADDRARYPGPLVAAIDELGRDLGVEVVVVPLADNQRSAVAFLASVGAARECAFDEVPDVLGDLLGDEVGRDRLGRAARATIDGAGATRVAGALIELAENGR